MCSYFFNVLPSIKTVMRTYLCATVAQLVEQLIRNQQVAGSSPASSSNLFPFGEFFYYIQKEVFVLISPIVTLYT